MRKYVVIFFVSLAVFICTSFAFASYDLLFGDVRLNPDPTKEVVDVEVGLSSDQLITKAKLNYWWDDEIYTYEVAEKELQTPFLNVKLQLDTNQIPLDQVIYFRLTAMDQQGEVFEWDECFSPQFNWSDLSWDVVESDHVILQYKSLNNEKAQQLLMLAEESYQGISEVLNTELDDKVKIIVLNSYEQFFAEKKYMDKLKCTEGHFTGRYVGDQTILIYSKQFIPADLKHTITHEITHMFKDEGFYPKGVLPSIKTMPFYLFDELIAEYVSMPIVYGDQVIDLARDAVNPKAFEWKISSFTWYYDFQTAVLFFDYLLEKYETSEIKEALIEFTKDEDFKELFFSNDFYSYLSSRYSISLDSKTIGSKAYPEESINTKAYYSYNTQLDQIAVALNPTLLNTESVANDIAIIDINDQSQSQLTSNYFYEIGPVWSKDNQHIYFTQQIGNEYSIVKMRLKDRYIKRLYTTTNQLLDLGSSPDGEKLVFVQRDDLYHSRLMLLNLNDQMVEQITSGETLVHSPIFRTNDEILVISQPQDQSSNVFKMKLSDLKPLVIPHIENVYRILAVKGNKCLYYKNNYFTYSLNLLDLEQQQDQILFDEMQLDNVMFPTLTDDGLLYYEGNPPESLRQKIRFID